MALKGKGMDPAAGSWTLDPVFEGSSFQFGYLVSELGLVGLSAYKICGPPRCSSMHRHATMACPPSQLRGNSPKSPPTCQIASPLPA